MPADAWHARAAYMAGSDQTEAEPRPADTQDVGVIDEQKAVAVLYQMFSSFLEEREVGSQLNLWVQEPILHAQTGLVGCNR